MNNAGDKNIRSVSIPRTVCGGLQYKVYMIFYLK